MITGLPITLKSTTDLGVNMRQFVGFARGVSASGDDYSSASSDYGVFSGSTGSNYAFYNRERTSLTLLLLQTKKLKSFPLLPTQI